MEEKAIPPAPVWSDVRTLCDGDFRTYMEGLEVDLVCGGYPCQPFSVAGKQLGEKDDRNLWPYIAEAIGTYAPRLCFFENVPGHITKGFDTVCSDLRSMGYEIAAGLFAAEEVGASHKRERLFVLAHRLGCNGDAGTERPGREAGTNTGRCGARAEVGHAAWLRELRCDREARDGGRTVETGQQLADTGGCELEGWKGERGDHDEELPATTGGGRVRLFPPGPSDIDGWREVLEIDPTLEPAICRVADGLAFRVERLRMLGNGVVPLQAAYAFVTLWAALFADDKGKEFLG
jgi:DNA (cytosine-5)-methyltransferase 1